MDFFKLRESAGEFGTDKLKKKYEDDTPGQNEKYRPPTKAEIDADRKKDQKGKPRPSISAKSVNRKVYGKMMGGLKEGINQKAFAAGAKGMKAYAQKSGGIDKADFMKVAKSLETISSINILQAGQELSRLNRLVNGMDTDVRERIFVELKKVGLVESMNEELSVSDGVAKWITDFQASDAPQFQGKSDDEKKKMAIAAFMAAKQKDGGDDKKPQKDENTRASLMKKLAKSAASSKKGKEKVTLKKAPWDKKNESLDEAAPKIKGPSVKGGKIMGVPGKKLGQKLDIEPQVSGMKLMFRVTSDDGSFKTVDVAGLAKMVK